MTRVRRVGSDPHQEPGVPIGPSLREGHVLWTVGTALVAEVEHPTTDSHCLL